MRIPIEVVNKISKIGVVEIERDVVVDPVFLKNLESVVKRSHRDIKHCAFIQIIETMDGEGWVYLLPKNGRVQDRYLFNPTIHKRFKKKKMTEELWHGEQEPSLKQIQQHSKLIKLAEIE